MAGIDKTYAKTYEDYKEVLDWCKSVGVVIDDYGNKMQPYSWLYSTDLTENDFGKDENGNDKWRTIWNTGSIQDLYIIRHCPCKVVQKRMREVYPLDYINDVLNFNTEYDKFKRPENKDPHFTIKWIKNPHKKKSRIIWDVNAYGENGKLYEYDAPTYDNYDDRWQFEYDTNYSEYFDYTIVLKGGLRGVLTNRRIYRKLRKWNLPKGTKLNFRGFSKDCYWEFDLIIK